MAFALIGLSAGWLYFLTTLPSPEDLRQYTTAPSSKIFDRYGRLLYEMPPPYTGFHTPVSLSDIPLPLQQATIATEDASFYTNPGFDLRGILRAFWANLRGGEVVMGGSTLTQQLVRILMFSPTERYEQTALRKAREATLAVLLTQRYSKDELLEFYLNEAYYGNMAYGVEAAARTYFGKSARDLDLAECALLAGLPQSPVGYNPFEDLAAAQARQSVVLERMVAEGYISAAEADLARTETLYLASIPFDIRAPHFVMYVRAQLERQLGRERLEAGGLYIYTTLDIDLTETARDLMRHRLSLLARCEGQPEACPPGGRNVRNAALVALDPRTGEILALVGSPDYFSTRIAGAVNAATALRQPGSSIKPLTYAAAFEQGALTPATMLLDVQTAFPTREGSPYIPLNYDLRFHGPVRARVALAASYNVPAVKVLQSIGVETLLAFAARLGISTFDPARLGLAVTLGGGEVRLLEETAAYAAFANGGQRVQPVAVLRVEDAAGEVLWESAPAIGPQTLDPRVAYLITDILSDDVARAPTFGEGSMLALSRPAAVKTGTTTDFRDNWTVGYTPELVAGVWVGNADNEPMFQISGVSGAGPLWHDFMEAALQGRPAQAFPRPAGLVEVEVCAVSGMLPGPACTHRVKELFIAGTEPTETCTVHQVIEGRVYTVLPPEARAWAEAHGLPQPAPGQAETGGAAALILTAPAPGATYRLDPAVERAAQRIAVRAEAGAALARVVLRVDGALLAEFAAPPYQAYWALQPGAHTFTAEGVDAAGHLVTSAAVVIQVGK